MKTQTFLEFKRQLKSGLLAAQSDDERVGVTGDTLKEFLLNSFFMHECIERVLASMRNGRSNWRNPPIDADIDGGYVIRMLFWPARFTSDIHRHNLWTVTGVLYNTIEVTVYDASGSTEITKYVGSQGAVGKVVPPCVHAAANPTDVPSVSLAVFCRKLKRDRAGPEVEWITNTEEQKYTLGIYERALRAFVFMIDANPNDESIEILDVIYDLAKPSLKLLAIKAMAQLDVSHASRRLDNLRFYIEDREIRQNVDRVFDQLSAAVA